MSPDLNLAHPPLSHADGDDEQRDDEAARCHRPLWAETLGGGSAQKTAERHRADEAQNPDAHHAPAHPVGDEMLQERFSRDQGRGVWPILFGLKREHDRFWRDTEAHRNDARADASADEQMPATFDDVAQRIALAEL